jgi:hypothetical protein
MAGETTTNLLDYTVPLISSIAAGHLVAQPHSVEIAATQMETNDITGVARIPKNSTLLGFFLQTDDLDSNGSEALVWSVLAGSTALKTGITNANAQVGTFYACVSGPLTVTADTIINMKSTTAAGTGAAGTINLTPVYVTSD